ncbi:hypothetical protein NsoK4_04200 [Nitrosopumilus sp. K4]|uniref:hypothetical protein n=1 Tax=Nitrosopumilus sp. K4 TaxID=2795383 RepID=UPI001BACE46B|nr:hypothetical protein [Nitrosopumilus sp. K4]QUC65453.1 hypothetical protein NsoK4_04200 [Nitrosopumilus sp. K4]
MQSTESTPKEGVPNVSSTLDQLNNLISESLQIYELENQKANTIDDLYNSLKIITEFLSFSVTIHPGIFHLPEDSQITLLPNLDMVIRLANGKTEIKKISDYSPDTLTQIIQYVIPQILQLITSEKAYLTEKITFLRSATKQLSQLSNLRNGATTTPENPDGVPQ